MRTRTPSGQLAESGGLDRLLDLTAAAASDRGAVVHRWLEMIEWIEDGVPPANEMLAAAAERAPLLGRAAELLGSFREWIEAPAIRRLLSRDAFPWGTGVGREQPFLVREKDVLVEGRVDRVLRMNEVDEPAGPTILIVDWKTDALDPGDIDSVDRRAAAYEPQIHAYRRALSAAERVPLSRVTGCIAFLTAGLVRQFVDTP